MENLNLGERKFGILSYSVTLICVLGVLKFDQTRNRSVFTNGCIISVPPKPGYGPHSADLVPSSSTDKFQKNAIRLAVEYDTCSTHKSF